MAARGRTPKIPIKARPLWSQRLILAREAAELSQGELSERSGVPQTTIGGYETGESQPDFAKLKLLATTLGVAPEWIAFADLAEPGEQDALVGPLFERHKKDEAFVATFMRTAAMLGEEGFNTDLGFAVRIAIRLTQEVKAGPDHMGIGERIERAVRHERDELRREKDRVRKNRL